MLDMKRALAAKPKGGQGGVFMPLSTKWGRELQNAAGFPSADSGESTEIPKGEFGGVVPRSEHPNPQFERDSYASLNGWWTCAFAECEYDPRESTRNVCASAARPSNIETPILVPFSPETSLSGVERQLKPNELLWYRTEVSLPESMHESMDCGEHVLLHFEAVDDTCAVWCNGILLGTHEGGYLPFCFDITDVIEATESADTCAVLIELCVTDPSDKGVQLRGKQKLESGDFWYNAQSGIWQPVWMECVPAFYLRSVRYEIDAMAGLLIVRAHTCGEGILSVDLSDGKTVVARGKASTDCEHVEVQLEVGNPHLWCPEDPFLYQVTLRFADGFGAKDTVRSYCAWRVAEVCPDGSGGSRFFLNGEQLFLKGVLDQGYWPESLMTAPDDEAFVHDILQMKSCGFNMLRKHVKLEAARFYYHCDRLGMLVWQDMVNGGGEYDEMWTVYLPTVVKQSWHRFADTDLPHTRKLGGDNRHYRDLWWQTCRQALERLGDHPCVVTWVLFNEGWGQFDSVGFTNLVRELDPSRPVLSTSGWYDQGKGNYIGVHNYFRDQEVFRDWRQRKWRVGRACVTSELGGLVLCLPEHSHVGQGYGFDVFDDALAWQDAVRDLLAKLDELENQGLAGYVYTQLSDVGEEANGILTADRVVNKLAVE